MMKIALNKLIRDEKGQVMILVLILLVLGSLIIAPLLGFMSTGIMAGQTFENKMYEFYAADAGVEDGIWNLIYDYPPSLWNVPYSHSYLLENVNSPTVESISITIVYILADEVHEITSTAGGTTIKAYVTGIVRIYIGDWDIGGNETIVGDVNVDGSVDMSGTSSITGNVNVTGDIRMRGDSEINGDVCVEGDLTMTGNNAVIIGDVYVTGNLFMSGNVRIMGIAYVGGAVDIRGGASVDGGVVPVVDPPPCPIPESSSDIEVWEIIG